MHKLFAILFLATLSNARAHQSFSILTLNLHGYHATNESLRFAEDRTGKQFPVPSSPFFFSPEEIERGRALRIEMLSKDLRELKPDFLFLQEVGAGWYTQSSNCQDFYNPSLPTKSLNSATRLLRGFPYLLSLACRGNVGWQTDRSSFEDFRILRKIGSQTEIVHDFGSNPYPLGWIVEGTAIAIHNSWHVTETRWLKLNFPSGAQSFFQYAVVQRQGVKILLVNIHGTHKLLHFESAVFIRNKIQDLLEKHQTEHLIMAGDFNAYLYRPEKQDSEISSAPWELSTPSLDLFTYSPKLRQHLKIELEKLNRDKSFKKWANITNLSLEKHIIESSLNGLENFLARNPSPLRPALETALQKNRCHPTQRFHESCSRSQQIDHILISPQLRVDEAKVLFNHHNWTRLEGTVSDHPAIWTKLSLQ